jgi:hypothetical protein
MGLSDTDLQRFVVEEFVNRGVDDPDKEISSVDSELCKSVQAKPRVYDSDCMTGPELLP